MFTPEVLEELTVDHTSSKDVILPRLRHLFIGGRSFTGTELMGMVWSRWNIGQSHRVERLQTLKLYFRERWYAEAIESFMLEEFEGCVMEGFSFGICCVLP